MIVDAGTADRSAFAEPFDMCIVGAGPAGITLARRGSPPRGDRCRPDGGRRRRLSNESQDLYAGRTFGLDYFPLEAARLRFLGGSSNHWAGACRELDAHDFEPRPHHPWSGWPIGKADLDPYRRKSPGSSAWTARAFPTSRCGGTATISGGFSTGTCAPRSASARRSTTRSQPATPSASR
jgi:choline dehydrogenase-like flavoprotein